MISGEAIHQQDKRLGVVAYLVALKGGDARPLMTDKALADYLDLEKKEGPLTSFQLVEMYADPWPTQTNLLFKVIRGGKAHCDLVIVQNWQCLGILEDDRELPSPEEARNQFLKDADYSRVYGR